tara:strand:+ start:479 stop:769 length:291 start_codon:yes stop_codon:yes gene_type:complete
MRISISNAAGILSLTEDEVLMESQTCDDLTAHYLVPSDMIYNDDGTVQFVDGNPDASWEFEMEEVLAYKQALDEKRQAEGAKKLSAAVKTALDLED